EDLPHENSEIERARVDQQAFEDVLMAAQVNPAQPAGVVDVSEGPLHVLTASTQQPLTSRSAHAPAIAVNGTLRVRGVRPAAAPTIRLGKVRPYADRVQIDHRLIAVIPLVGDKLGERRRRGAGGGRRPPPFRRGAPPPPPAR